MSVERRPAPRPPRTVRGAQPCVLPDVPLDAADTESLVAALLCRVGEDLTREGLHHTPDRVARSLEFLTSGYRQQLHEVVNGAVFAEPYSEMVLVKDIEVYSLCEHHLLPFFGRAHVAYVPDGRVIGLSKLPRLVDVFARRLQVQERLTTEIAEAVDEVLAPAGVGVIIEAAHLCMMMRGVQQQNSRTVTSSMRGVFLRDPRTRDEFLALVHGDARRI
ncbi:MAG TPA: GTP cyclohydrolase I FolE [Candidatus Dormibacteraeota bacterium]|nr:GTP cyclohydrolase I FolE [Candidatus Dormibacteraeota bacterium]